MNRPCSCPTKAYSYFCSMQFFHRRGLNVLHYNLLLVGFLTVVSCSSLWKKDNEKKALARVGDTYLYRDDVAPLLNTSMSPQDSASFVTNYINNWATKQLLLSKAQINLPEEQLREFDQLVANSGRICIPGRTKRH